MSSTGSQYRLFQIAPRGSWMHMNLWLVKLLTIIKSRQFYK